MTEYERIHDEFSAATAKMSEEQANKLWEIFDKIKDKLRKEDEGLPEIDGITKKVKEEVFGVKLVDKFDKLSKGVKEKLNELD